jgi:PKD repeat protein
MATPHVVGVAALIWSHYPGASNDEIRAALTATAEDRGDPGRDNYYGYGIVKAAAALDYLGGGSTTDPEPPQNQPPGALISSGCTDLGCSFDGSGSTDSDGTIVAYRWDFGDGNTATGATASHTYAVAGSYTVTLEVEDDDGATATTTATVFAGDTSVAVEITNVSAKTTKGKSFEISWSTNVPADTQVTFSCCGTFSDAQLVTDHRMTFRGNRGELYEYTVTSTDGNGVSVTEGPFTFQN